MTFSILIASYNCEKYIEECLNSVLLQTYKDFEIIVVDDCSTDNSIVLIKKFCQLYPQIKLYINEKNMGVGYTKDKCIKLANGNLCGFLDSDDTLNPNALEAMHSLESKSAVAAYSQFYICDDNLNKKFIFKKTLNIEKHSPLFFNIGFEVAHFFVFKKSEYLKTEGINTSLHSAVDQDLYLKLYDIGDFIFVKKPLYNYRTHSKGISQDKASKKNLYENWNIVLKNTLKRRRITKLYGTDIDTIPNLSLFIHEKKISYIERLKRLFW